MSYDSSDSTWDFQFMLFLFNPSDINRYKLSCDIQVCNYSGDPATTCNTVATSCLNDSSNYFTACAEGENWNAEENTCESPAGAAVSYQNTVWVNWRYFDVIVGFQFDDVTEAFTEVGRIMGKQGKVCFDESNDSTCADLTPNNGGMVAMGWNYASGRLELINSEYNQHAHIDPADGSVLVTNLQDEGDPTSKQSASLIYSPKLGMVLVNSAQEFMQITPNAESFNLPDVPYANNGGQIVYHDGKIFVPGDGLSIFYEDTMTWTGIDTGYSSSEPIMTVNPLGYVRIYDENGVNMWYLENFDRTKTDSVSTVTYGAFPEGKKTSNENGFVHPVFGSGSAQTDYLFYGNLCKTWCGGREYTYLSDGSQSNVEWTGAYSVYDPNTMYSLNPNGSDDNYLALGIDTEDPNGDDYIHNGTVEYGRNKRDTTELVHSRQKRGHGNHNMYHCWS